MGNGIQCALSNLYTAIEACPCSVGKRQQLIQAHEHYTGQFAIHPSRLHIQRSDSNSAFRTTMQTRFQSTHRMHRSDFSSSLGIPHTQTRFQSIGVTTKVRFQFIPRTITYRPGSKHLSGTNIQGEDPKHPSGSPKAN